MSSPFDLCWPNKVALVGRESVPPLPLPGKHIIILATGQRIFSRTRVWNKPHPSTQNFSLPRFKRSVYCRRRRRWSRSMAAEGSSRPQLRAV